MSETSRESSFQDEVLNELGEERLLELADLLGTDAEGAQRFVGSSVSELSDELRSAAAEPVGADEVSAPGLPLEGVATLGGLVGGGLMAGALAKLARPAADAVARRTGLPAPAVTRTIELLLPVVLAVIGKRAAGGKAGALGDILGGGKR
ncbi:hypothetical protein ABZ135_08135 [Streptomyces sp. NPDC006339]|uniref:hypothetical protein n=1 Tax=Streptomyces sp. NPDC006339 TaxID=3156755 RepID=UPI0033AC2BE4